MTSRPECVRVVLILGYGLGVWLLPHTAPWPGLTDRMLWEAFGIILALTSFMDLFTSQIFLIWPLIAMGLWVGWFGLQVLFGAHFVVLPIVRGIAINGGVLALWPFILGRFRARLAHGDWLVYGAGALYLSVAPAYFVLWLIGGFLLVHAFRRMLQTFWLSLPTVPFLPFALVAYLLVAVVWPHLPPRFTTPI